MATSQPSPVPSPPQAQLYAPQPSPPPAAAPPPQPPPAAVPAQTATVPASSNLPPITGLEIARLILYALCFVFGVLCWGITADKLNIRGINLVTLETERCYYFSPNGNDSSPVCNVVIAFGVLLMLALLTMVIWHVLRFVPNTTLPLLPYRVEFIAFSVMAAIWLILGITTAATKASSFLDDVETEVDVAISAAWLSFALHAAVAVITFLDMRAAPKTDATAPAVGSTAASSPLQQQQPQQQQPYGVPATPQQYATQPYPQYAATPPPTAQHPGAAYSQPQPQPPPPPPPTAQYPGAGYLQPPLAQAQAQAQYAAPAP